jgi:hypothetical protein
MSPRPLPVFIAFWAAVLLAGDSLSGELPGLTGVAEAACRRDPTICAQARNLAAATDSHKDAVDHCVQTSCPQAASDELHYRWRLLASRAAGEEPGYRVPFPEAAQALAQARTALSALRPPDIGGMAFAAAEALCAERPAACERARGLVRDTRAVKSECASCEGGACPLPALDACHVRSNELYIRSLILASSVPNAQADMSPVTELMQDINDMLHAASAKAIPPVLESVRVRFDAHEREISALEKKMGSHWGDTEGLSAEFAVLRQRQAADLGSFRALSRSIDFGMGKDHEKQARMAADSNAMALRGAQLRDRLHAMGRVFPERTPEGTPAALAAAASAAPPAPGRLGSSGSSRTQPRPSNAVPPPGKDDYDVELSLKARFGLSRIVGDPSGRARLVHGQDPATCAIVAQQQILAAAGLVESRDPKTAERRLRDEAVAKGYFERGTIDGGYAVDFGTPHQFTASLLVEKGLLVTKHVLAADEDLERSVSAGKMLIVGLDSGLLWDLPEHRGTGHAVVVTGAEVSRFDGRVTAFYINDSGTEPPGRGRRIPGEDFFKAWHAMGRRFIEVQ